MKIKTTKDWSKKRDLCIYLPLSNQDYEYMDDDIISLAHDLEEILEQLAIKGDFGIIEILYSHPGTADEN